MLNILFKLINFCENGGDNPNLNYYVWWRLTNQYLLYAVLHITTRYKPISDCVVIIC